jgi:hypothetical protein
MPKGSKLKEELKQDEDGTILIPKESLPEVPITVAKKSVKRVLSEKQMENAKKLGEASKARWEKLREEKARLKAEAEAKEKEEEKKLIDAGTHVRVKVAEKGKPRGRPIKKEPMPKPLKLVRQPAYEETDDSSDNDDSGYTETEEDTDVEERPSRVRRQVKKNLKVLARVDEALAQAPTNPYISMLSGRWK